MNVISAVVRQYNFFGFEFEFDNIAFTIGNFSVYWYGIIIAVGFLLALAYGYRNASRYGIDKDRMIDVVIVGLVGAIIGARLFYIIGDNVPLSNFPTFGDKLAYICGIHEGGIGILGGVIGAFLCGGLMAKLRKINVLDMFDLAGTGFLIGQIVGRLGNFVNQEVYGLPTGSDWYGIGGSRIGSELVHPLFLYEMLWNLAVFIVLHNLSKKRRFKGQIFLGYIMAYTFGRYWLESMRSIDFILKLGKISQSQLFCIGLFVAAIIAYVILAGRAKSDGKEAGYAEVFGEICDDEEVLAAAYDLLGCTDDSTDSEVESAYNVLRDKYEAMLPDESDADTSDDDSAILSKFEQRKRDRLARKAAEEQAEREQSILASDAPETDEDGMIEISVEELTIRAKAKLASLERAYKYIRGNRELTSLERAEFEKTNEEADRDEAN